MSDPEQHNAEHDASVDDSDPNSSSTAYVGFIGIVFLFVSIVGLQAWFRAYQYGERVSKVVSQPSRDLEQLRATQGAQLEGYRWVDAENKVVGIPIDRAMGLVTGELQSR